MALAQEEMIGHAGDVVADDAVRRLLQSQFGVLGWHAPGVVEEKREKGIERGYGGGLVWGGTLDDPPPSASELIAPPPCPVAPEPPEAPPVIGAPPPPACPATAAPPSPLPQEPSARTQENDRTQDARVFIRTSPGIVQTLATQRIIPDGSPLAREQAIARVLRRAPWESRSTSHFLTRVRQCP